MTSHQERRRSFREESLEAWRTLTEGFAGPRPIVTWSEVEDIVDVLVDIGEKAPLNHLFFPSGGGLDIEGSTYSHEERCIELDFGGNTCIVRPVSLQLVMPERDPLREWAYFLLQTGELAPSGVYENGSEETFESVLELAPGEYVESFYWDEGYYGVDETGDRRELPEGARRIERCFGGSFLITAKASGYNLSDVFDAYRATHTKRSPAEFQSFTQEVVDGLQQRGLYGIDPEAWAVSAMAKR